MNDKELVIKPTKKFCQDRVFLRFEGRSLTAAEQKLLDFLLWCSIEYQSNVIQFSPFEYFNFYSIKNPNSKQYREFYEMLKVLFNTCIFWEFENVDVASHLLDDLIFNDGDGKRKRITQIQVKLHPSLLHALTWERSNIILNLSYTKELKFEYSYYLFIFLLVDYIGDGRKHTYKGVQLRNYLNVDNKQEDKIFKEALRRAVKEISRKTFLSLALTIRGQTFHIWNREVIESCSKLKNTKKSKNFNNEEINRIKRLEIMVEQLQNNPIFKDGVFSE